MSSSLTVKRGGSHPIFGIYVGGSPITSKYKLSQPDGYNSTSQLRSEKSLNLVETALHTKRDDTTTLKFNGKLDVATNTASLSELTLEDFLRAVGSIVERFGLETFFYLPDTSGNMQYLPEDPHTFTLEAVMAEHKSRLVEPAEVKDTNNVETPASILARFRTYDEYEKCDISLSKLAIESLVHSELRAEIIVQLSHLDNFKKIPGSVYLMMVLDVCHESFSFKLEDAAKSLKTLSLADYPGENVSKFSNEVQRLVKVLKGGYALPYQTGSQIVRKVCNTQSLYFNRTM